MSFLWLDSPFLLRLHISPSAYTEVYLPVHPPENILVASKILYNYEYIINKQL